MRLVHLIGGDLTFTRKYGILYLYLLLTAVYLIFLAALPQEFRLTTGAILIFTDPAAMGLFFMGAMVMLEKSQGVNSALAVTPITIGEYLTAKVVSLALLGTGVAAIIGLFAGSPDLLLLCAGVALSSALFSLCGLLAAVSSGTLNGFLLRAIPFELLLSVPALLGLFGIVNGGAWVVHPGIAAMMLIGGKSELWPWCLLSLLVWSAVLFLVCKKSVNRYFSQLGGGSL